MKRNIDKPLLAPLSTIAIYLLLVTAGCTKGGALEGLQGDVYAVNGSAAGSQVVPASNATGTATITGIFDASANSFTYTIKWSALWTAPVKDTITKALFFSPGIAGQNGDSVKNISIPIAKMLKPTDSITNSLSGNLSLSDKERDDLIAGKWYYTIFTKKYPNGAVRAQLNAEKRN